MKYRGVLRVSPEFLIGLMYGLESGDYPRAFMVERGLPIDTSVVRMFTDQLSDTTMLIIESTNPFSITEPAAIHQSGYPFVDEPRLSVVYPKAGAA